MKIAATEFDNIGDGRYQSEKIVEPKKHRYHQSKEFNLQRNLDLDIDIHTDSDLNANKGRLQVEAPERRDNIMRK